MIVLWLMHINQRRLYQYTWSHIFLECHADTCPSLLLNTLLKRGCSLKFNHIEATALKRGCEKTPQKYRVN